MFSSSSRFKKGGGLMVLGFALVCAGVVKAADGMLSIGDDFMVFKQQGATSEIFAGIGTDTPQAKLEVVGNVIADVPTANEHLATKAYVDASEGGLIAEAGSGLGTCYYVYTGDGCGQGFYEMPGSYRPYSGGTHKICCSSGFFAEDTSPNAYDIPDYGIARNQLFVSNIYQVSGVTSADMSVSGEGSPEYRLCNNNDCTDILSNWSSATRKVSESQYYQVRNTSKPTDGTTVATLEIGTGTDSWTLTSPATPTAFSFVDQYADTSIVVESEIKRITGVYSADISIDAEGEYRICSDASCSSVVTDWTQTDTVALNNQYVQVRMTTADTEDTLKSTNITIGSLGVPFTVTTIIRPIITSVTHEANKSRYMRITFTGGKNVGTVKVMAGTSQVASINLNNSRTNHQIQMNNIGSAWSYLPITFVGTTSVYDSGAKGSITCTGGNAGPVALDQLDNDCNGLFDDAVYYNYQSYGLPTVTSGTCNNTPVYYGQAAQWCQLVKGQYGGNYSSYFYPSDSKACYYGSPVSGQWNERIDGGLASTNSITCYDLLRYN